MHSALSTLHFFNPDHDLALAHGTNHYVSPASALKFAADAVTLPAWLFGNGYVFVNEEIKDVGFLENCEKLGVRCRFVTEKEVAGLCAETGVVNRIEPWGWNDNICKKAVKMGVNPAVLPTADGLARVRELSHRRLTVKAARFLGASAPAELTSIGEVEAYVQRHGRVVLKMPWSGSGRGLRRIDGAMNEHQRGWAQQSIRKYGCVMGEPFREVVQDFAMEFRCAAGRTDFCGYSLFSTRNGVYQGNILASDADIESHIAQFVGTQQIAATKSKLLRFLDEQVAPHYQGCVGVDMFVYREDDGYRLCPCVEFNLRMTMGLLSSVFCRRYLLKVQNPLLKAPKSVLKMQHSAKKGELLEQHLWLSQERPLVVSGGRIVSGHLSLTPVSEDTEYAVWVEV